MANPRHVDLLKQGVKAWNAWRHKSPRTRPDLSEEYLDGMILGEANLAKANLNGAELNGVNLRSANLTGASLRGANLINSRLHMANLTDADLSHSNFEGSELVKSILIRSDFHGAVLARVDLSEADLTSAKLTDTDLMSAVFRRTILDNTEFGEGQFGYVTLTDLDLSRTVGLEKLDHQGPSNIGIDTIYRSHGRIPEIFLRGVGVPDSLISFVGSLVGPAIEFHSCFISYSTRDQEFADKLYNDLQSNGVRCWFAPHDVRGGKKLHEQIDQAIRVNDKLLLILSSASMASAWVKTEIVKARKREINESRQVLFPLRLIDFDSLLSWECFDADTGTDSAREIREYFIPDFSNWMNPECYQKSFGQLLRDLRAGSQGAQHKGESAG